ncbi:MAG: hypothetical protein ACTS4U_00595 [Candidatus Hodgkinia cicadicola]
MKGKNPLKRRVKALRNAWGVKVTAAGPLLSKSAEDVRFERWIWFLRGKLRFYFKLFLKRKNLLNNIGARALLVTLRPLRRS